MICCPLPQRWRELAELLRDTAAADSAARAYERAAAELEAWQAERDDALLTLAEAAERTGRSAETIRKRVGTPELPNHGKKHSPRVRAGDLRVAFPTRRLAPGAGSTYDVNADARLLLASRGGR